jgi:tRNA uridine 5-carboxymethylaminomethyl modification enzyme
LSLREDNADLRLTPRGRELGLVDDERWQFFATKRDGVDREVARLKNTIVQPYHVSEETSAQVFGAALNRETWAFDLLRRPEVSYERLVELDAVGSIVDPVIRGDDRLLEQVALQVDVQAKYVGYLDRQNKEIERQNRNEDTRLPTGLDYTCVRGLSHEVRQRLAEARPLTLGQASRVRGVTPAAISLLLVHLKKSG